jgi:hypothetical protein
MYIYIHKTCFLGLKSSDVIIDSLLVFRQIIKHLSINKCSLSKLVLARMLRLAFDWPIPKKREIKTTEET